ncbi:unnamed protein product [Brachionus calyciflorus]|uniref:Integrase catalytic domain-containing protein n=1 Tax=Brachionus calyciflorus TaxID=104777 RepID=A0A814PL42_9BILA|nr:unnamed protein product [Brachionus calyciflorus]
MIPVQTLQPRLKPISSVEFWVRTQLDLIDMRHNPCKKGSKEFKWIAHIEDHFTKFHVIWAMENKSADEVCYGLKRFVFPYFGLPNTFQCDNGTEFKNSLVKRLIEEWEGDCKMVHGRPRHRQSQGLVEQANGTIERMLASSMSQFQTTDWEDLLTQIMYNLNTQIHLVNFFNFIFMA